MKKYTNRTIRKNNNITRKTKNKSDKHKEKKIDTKYLKDVEENMYKTLSYGVQTLQNKIQNGGVILNPNTLFDIESPENSLDYFINECFKTGGKIEKLDTYSSAGMMIILTLPEESPSIYTSYSAKNICEPKIGDIRQIILKFVLITSKDELVYEKLDYVRINKDLKLEVNLSENFNNECLKQQIISLKTANDDICGKYEKATPYIVYKSNNNNNIDLLGIDVKNPKKGCETSLVKLLETDDGSSINWQDFYKILKEDSVDFQYNGKKRVKLGVMAMTMATEENDKIVSSPSIEIQEDNEISPLKICVVYELIRCMVFSKNLHQDLHEGNYFIKEISDDLIEGRRVAKVNDELKRQLRLEEVDGVEWWKYQSIIIDWGRLEMLDDDELNLLRNKWDRTAKLTMDIESTSYFFYECLQKIYDLLKYTISYDGYYPNTIGTILVAAGIKSDKSDTFFPYPNKHYKLLSDNDDKIFSLARKLGQYHKLCYIASNKNVEKANKKWVKYTDSAPEIPSLKLFIDTLDSLETSLLGGNNKKTKKFKNKKTKKLKIKKQKNKK
jgi:hypothetical protein